jgi:[phosphatase 2A protein]-leucine-carboxy methyltransferase
MILGLELAIHAGIFRITKLEMLDEVEELELVLEHYAVTWGVKCPEDSSIAAIWSGWGMEPNDETLDTDSD